MKKSIFAFLSILLAAATLLLSACAGESAPTPASPSGAQTSALTSGSGSATGADPSTDGTTAYEEPDNGFQWEARDGAIAVTGYHGTQADVVIPDGICGLPVTAIGKTAFQFSSIRSVVIPDSVTTIGEGAFDGCAELTDVTLGRNVTNVGQHVFEQCPKLRFHEYENGLYLGCAGSDYFYFVRPEDYSIQKLHADTKIIGSYAFENRRVSSPFTFPEGLVTICEGAFRGCGSIGGKITLPDSLVTIGMYAFANCSGLTKITIPDSVKTLGSFAFNSCENLQDVILGNGLEAVESSVFGNCKRLWYNKSGNAKYLGTADNKYYALAGADGNEDPVTIHPDTKVILGGAFDAVTTDAKITVPEGVRVIGGGAFYGCLGLTTVEIPDSVVFIGSGAFGRCPKLNSVTIPDSVKTVGTGVFAECTSLRSVALPAGLKRIPDRTFRNCGALENVSIPDGVLSIGEEAFSGCTALRNVTLPNGLMTISGGAFAGCLKLEPLTLGVGVRQIGNNAFDGCCFGALRYRGSSSLWEQITVGENNDVLNSLQIVFDYTEE